MKNIDILCINVFYLKKFILSKRIKQMKKNKIKVIIFDFDNTLYSGVDWTTTWSEYCKQGLRQVMKDYSDEEFEESLKKNEMDVFSNRKVVNFIFQNNLNMKEWLKYRTETLCDLDLTKAISISNEELKKFKKDYKLYIVSNSVMSNIISVAKYFDIDLSLFEEIITNDYSHGVDKKFYYEQIIEKEKISPEELIVLGDDKLTDLVPAEELGAKTIYIKTADYTKKSLGL